MLKIWVIPLVKYVTRGIPVLNSLKKDEVQCLVFFLFSSRFCLIEWTILPIFVVNVKPCWI